MIKFAQVFFGIGGGKSFYSKDLQGFTLAEVLITLGIIGVVAAMTMPSLLNATQGKQYVTAYKRALATLSQAGAMNYALEDVDFSCTTAGCVREILEKRMNVVKKEENNTKLYFNDGIMIYIPDTVNSCTDITDLTKKAEESSSGAKDACLTLIDVNGKKGPNVRGKDVMDIVFTRQGVVPADDTGRSIVNSDKLLQKNQ